MKFSYHRWTFFYLKVKIKRVYEAWIGIIILIICHIDNKSILGDIGLIWKLSHFIVHILRIWKILYYFVVNCGDALFFKCCNTETALCHSIAISWLFLSFSLTAWRPFVEFRIQMWHWCFICNDLYHINNWLQSYICRFLNKYLFNMLSHISWKSLEFNNFHVPTFGLVLTNVNWNIRFEIFVY